MTGEDWALIDAGCPKCGARQGGARGLHYHSLSVWCLRCGWAKNWKRETIGGGKEGASAQA